MRSRGKVGLAACALAFLLLLSVSGCFETSEKGWRWIRLCYTSDVIGNLEPCG